MGKKKATPVVVLMVVLVFEVQICGGTSPYHQQQQQEDDRVVHLPGLSVNVSFDHYSGYVGVNGERSLFYWFFEAAEDHASKPLVLWLQGGPGCSSIGFGEAQEIGPFTVNSDAKTVSLNPYSWNQAANILFVESPVGTGFSYSNNSSDFRTNGDNRSAHDLLEFLFNWLHRFPHYKQNDFYITGESYAGHYIPQLAQAIVKHHNSTGTRSINLKGYMVGNALTDDFNDHSGVSEFLWTTGLISDRTYKLRSIYCHNTSFLHTSPDCNRVADIVSAELGKIDIYSIYTPSCTTKKVGNINEKFDPCIKEHSGIYFNLPEVQKALHVNLEVAPPTWEICSDVIFHTWKDSASSVLGIYKELIASGLRIWMFSGDTDTVIPVTSTRYNIDALGLEPASPWRPWYDDGQVGGWTQQYVGLNFVTIRGAGHMVPLIKPKLAFVLFKSFLSGSPMPSPSPRISDS